MRPVRHFDLRIGADVGQMRGVEYKPYQAPEFPQPRALIGDVRGAMDNNQIVSRYYKCDLAAGAQSEESAGWQLDRRNHVVVEKACPP